MHSLQLYTKLKIRFKIVNVYVYSHFSLFTGTGLCGGLDNFDVLFGTIITIIVTSFHCLPYPITTLELMNLKELVSKDVKLNENNICRKMS